MSTISILLVEDDVNLARLIEIQMRATFDVQRAGTVRAALAALREHRFDVVILDVTLPDRPCWDLLPAIQQTNAHAKVLLMTGYSDSQVRDQAAAAGVRTVLTKPVTPAQIKAAIDSLLAED